MAESTDSKSPPMDRDAFARMLAQERESSKNEFELDLKDVNRLLVAHAAGMVTCVTLLKDYNGNAQLKGIGVFISLFGIGLIFAAAAYTAARMQHFIWTRVLDGKLDWAKKAKWPQYQTIIAEMISEALLIAAIIVMIVKFGSL